MFADTAPRHRNHSHQFDEGNPLAEKNTRWAVVLTATMMVAEISGGWFYNSMALLADGWHMSSHTLALGLSVLACSAARRYRHDSRFNFGTWKIEVLGGYTSAIFLVGVAGLMLYQSTERLISPTAIHYDQAIYIAIAGLAVNLICAWLLKEDHSHHHDGDETHHHKDLNLRSAYLHVLTDAATSVLAIIALFGGKLFGAIWLDPTMGIVGAALVSAWAYSLLRDTSKVLLDAEMDSPLVGKIRSAILADPATCEVTDIHLWRVGKGKYACILSLACNENVAPAYFKNALATFEEIAHFTVEVNLT